MSGVQLDQEFEVMLLERQTMLRQREQERLIAQATAENERDRQGALPSSSTVIRELLDRLRFSKPLRSQPAAR